MYFDKSAWCFASDYSSEPPPPSQDGDEFCYRIGFDRRAGLKHVLRNLMSYEWNCGNFWKALDYMKRLFEEEERERQEESAREAQRAEEG